jgi:hypothetical protein
MKISTMDFDEKKEPLVAIVVADCRKKGILPSVVKTALINEHLITAVWSNTNSSDRERLDAIALVQASINAQQKLVNICLYSITGESPMMACAPIPEKKVEDSAAAIVSEDDDDDLDEILDTY